MVTATGTAAPVRLAHLGGALLLLAVLLVGVPAPILAATDSNLCYIVADVGGGNGGNDLLIAFNRSDDSFTAVGTGTGTNDIEAADMWPGTDTLYAVDADELGTIDLATGVYSTLGGPFGLANGPDGPQTLSDADGIAVDPFTFVIWAAERNPGSPDYLFKIDPSTGAFIPDAFGPGLDYIVSTPTTDLPRSRDLDDIAISTTTGEVFGLANRGASTISQRLVTIDPLTGDQTLVGQLGVEDVEGLSFNPFGQLYATDGSDDLFFDVDPATGTITQTRQIGLAGDYESVSCLTGDTNLIEGTVFLDVNADGVQGPPEPGRADATVELVRDLDGDGVADPDEPVVAVRVTDANGDYDFEIAAVGDFVVRVNEATLPPGAEATSPPALPVTFDDVGLVVSEVDFGFIRPATVGDRVWLDLDGDGVQDEGEPGLAGVTVELQDGDGNVVDSTTTGGDGTYTFDAAADVDYAIVVTPPGGAAFTLQDVGGDDTVDSDVDAAGVTATIIPDLGANPQVGDAGVLPASIGDLVFLDNNGDGIQDDGDVGLAGIVVDLLDAEGAVIATTTTGDDGTYSFVGLVPGATYGVSVTAPDGASFSPQDVGDDDGIDSDVDAGGATGPIVPASGANPGVADAGIVAALLRGIVFIDDDADGTADPGEQPAPGVTVTLHDLTGAIIATTLTDADGAYEFTGLLPGAGYRVSFTADGEFSPVGATSDVDSDGTVVVAITSGVNVGDADAGIIPPPSPPSPSPSPSPSPTPSTTPVEPPPSPPPATGPPPPTPPLPATGAPLLALALLAAGLMLTGLALAAPRRRRTD